MLLAYAVLTHLVEGVVRPAMGALIAVAQNSGSHAVPRVERGDLVGLGERRVVEGVLDEVVERAPRLSTAWPMWISSVAPSPTMWTPSRRRVSSAKIIFRKPELSAHDVAARGLAETGDAASRRGCRVARLLFGHADGGDLRHRVDAVGKEFRRRRRGTPKAWQAAMRPCSIEVEARLGKADHVADGVDVRARRSGTSAGSTLSRPRSSAARPQRLEVEPVGRAHAAGGEQHHVGRTLRPSASCRPASCVLRHDATSTLAPSRKVTPRSRSSWMNSSTSSRSTKSSSVLRGSITVTFTSSAEKIVAYSMPMTLAPMTVRLRGRRFSSRISSLSRMLSPSNGMRRARKGRADGDHDASRRGSASSPPSSRGDLERGGSRGSARRRRPCHAVARELVLEHFDLVVERHVQAAARGRSALISFLTR